MAGAGACQSDPPRHRKSCLQPKLPPGLFFDKHAQVSHPDRLAQCRFEPSRQESVKRAAVCLGNTVGQGHVKPPLIHHVGVAPLFEQVPLPRVEPTAAACELRSRRLLPEAVELRYTFDGKFVEFPAWLPCAQRNEPAQIPDLKLRQ